MLLVGAGGLGGEVGHSQVRKGIGIVHTCDGDSVELSNLHRQRFFKKDLGKNKAVRLARNLAKEAPMETIIVGYPADLQRLIEEGLVPDCTVCFVGIDNNPGRTVAAKYFHDHGIPIVFAALTEDANHGYVYVQEPGKACFGCAFPDAVDDDTYPCPGAGAVIDILKVVTGLATFAIDTLIMPERKRDWNLRKIFMAGYIPDSSSWVKKRENCPICGDS